MEQLDIEKAKQILGNLKCEKGLVCVSLGLEELCKSRDIGLKSLLDCLEKHTSCVFTQPFGYGLMCKCPVRHYIKTELGK